MWSAKDNNEFIRSLMRISHSIQRNKNSIDMGMIQMKCDCDSKEISILSMDRNMKIKAVLSAGTVSNSFNIFFLYDYFKEIVEAFASSDDFMFDFKDKKLFMKSSVGEYSIGAIELKDMPVPNDLLYDEIVPDDIQDINGVVFFDNINDCGGFVSSDDSAQYEAITDVRVVSASGLSFVGTDSKTIVRKVDGDSDVSIVESFTCSPSFINALGDGGVTPKDRIGFIDGRIMYYNYSNIEIWSRINRGSYPPVDGVIGSNDFIYSFDVSVSGLSRALRGVGAIANKNPLSFMVASSDKIDTSSNNIDSVSISCNGDNGSSDLRIEVSNLIFDDEDGIGLSDTEFYVYKDKLYPVLSTVSSDMCRVCLHKNKKMLKLFSLSSDGKNILNDIHIVVALANSPVAESN